MVVTSLITLYYYLNISYSSFIILNTEPKWTLKFHKNKSTKSITALILSSASLTGICCEKFYSDVSVLRVMRSTRMCAAGNRRGSWAYLQSSCEDHNYLNVCPFVRPLVCQDATHSFPTGWIGITGIYEKLLTLSRFGQNRTEITDTLREILRTFVTTLVNIVVAVAVVSSVMWMM